ncbi:MAG: polysaccharide biosynthesis tyrosine autokinase [Parasporobacterium sp.]|nr:polysaccharide biosynthesis tyrosine autokinase [Parasporobacterium sp.]
MDKSRTVRKDDVIDLKKLALALWRKIWLLIIVTVIGAIVGYLGTLIFVTPTYMSSFAVYVNNYNNDQQLNSVNSGDIATRSKIASTAADIARRHTVRQKAAEKMGFNDYKDITVKTSVDDTSSVLTVSVIIKDRQMVRSCAEAFSEVLKEETERVIEGSSMQIIDAPEDPEGRYAPSYGGNAIKIGLLALVLAAVIICILTVLDDTITSSKELKDHYKNPVIGMIPDMAGNGVKTSRKGGEKAYLLEADSPFQVQEAYNNLRTNIQYSLPASQCHVIGITSADRSEGKSTTAINLATAFANLDKKVVLIDGDLRLPTVASKLNIRQNPGLSNYLIGESGLKEIGRKCSVKNLYVIPSGNIPPEPTWLLQSDRMKQLLEELKKNMDYIFIDLPPATIVSDAKILSNDLSGYILAVRRGATHFKAVDEMTGSLEMADAKILGFVMTHEAGAKSRYYKGGKYGYYKKGYEYGYGHNQKNSKVPNRK